MKPGAVLSVIQHLVPHELGGRSALRLDTDRSHLQKAVHSVMSVCHPPFLTRRNDKRRTPAIPRFSLHIHLVPIP
ncbi:hypothetical protein N7532_000072 [Penicillium argentinense]|uniref:Uncharacterized protein n=1 Tax=Penicillium argentinense TaxID=1131581 RepID=A0A9W9G632_9EURO|nr:uncharacterized protein N7532_000072 [Penicillium argentinense]KAJ5112027.1 hypothetical protein N7532_000072 [Penicillium argentinense]